MRTTSILLTALLILSVSLCGCASHRERQTAAMAKQMMQQMHEAKMAQIEAGQTATHMTEQEMEALADMIADKVVERLNKQK